MKHYEDGVKEQMDSMRRGLHLFVPEDLLEDFLPQGSAYSVNSPFSCLLLEIDQLIGGVEPSLEDLKAHVAYTDPLNDQAPLVKLFWDVVATFTDEELRRLVRFVTGTDKVRALMDISGRVIVAIMPRS